MPVHEIFLFWSVSPHFWPLPLKVGYFKSFTLNGMIFEQPDLLVWRVFSLHNWLPFPYEGPKIEDLSLYLSFSANTHWSNLFIITGERGHYGCLTGYKCNSDDHEISIILILYLLRKYKTSTCKWKGLSQHFCHQNRTSCVLILVIFIWKANQGFMFLYENKALT